MRRAGAIILTICVAACRPAPPPTTAAVPAKSRGSRPQDAERFQGPPVDFQLQNAADRDQVVNEVVITVQAPNASWGLTVDAGEHAGGLLRVYCTLTPSDANADDEVTAVTGSYREPLQTVSTVEVYMRIVGPDDAYRLARRKPDL